MADNSNYIGVAMGLDVTDLKAGISEANKQIQLANSKFKAASSGMEDWTKSADGLSAKIEQLDSVLQMQQAKLSGLKAEYAKVAEAQGENSDAAKKLQMQINNQQAAVNVTAREYKNYKATLEGVKSGEIDLEKVSLRAGKAIGKTAESIDETSRLIQLANSEFKAASSGMEDWTKSTDGLSAKIKQLDSVLNAQQSKLSSLKDEYEKVAKEQGENSDAARKLQIQINNQQAAVNDTSKEYKNYKKTLEDVENGTIDLEKVSLRAGKAVEDTGDAAEEAGDGFTVAKGAIAGFISNGLTALIGKAKDAISTVYGLADATREYRRTLATLDTAAEDVGVNTDYIRDKFADMMGVFNDEDSVTEGLNNLLTAGFDEKSLDQITEGLEGAALKWKDTLKFEGLSDSLQEWIGSNGENLTGNFAELLERMGYNLDDVKEKTKGMTDEQRRTYAVNLLASEGLAEVSQNYREQNKDMIEAQKTNVEYQNTLAKFGETTEPIVTTVKQGFIDLLKAVIALISGSDFESLKGKIESGFSTFINDILPKIVDGFKWIIDNKDTLIAGIAGIGAAMLTMNVANMIMGVVKAFKAFKKAQEGATIAQWLLNIAMNANPIGIIISLIAGLVTAFIILWNKSEAFRNFWKNLWSDIKGAFSKAWGKIKEGFSAIGDWFDDFKDAGKRIVEGIWEGITSGATWLKNKITGFAGDVASWFKDTFKINSPSKLIEDEVGQYVGQAVVPTSPRLLTKVKKNIAKFGHYVSDNMGKIKSGLTSGVVDNASQKSTVSDQKTYGSGSVVDARMTVNYNGKLSRKTLKRTENEHYIAVKTKLKAEGAI